jgi:hypothetical protein
LMASMTFAASAVVTALAVEEWRDRNARKVLAPNDEASAATAIPSPNVPVTAERASTATVTSFEKLSLPSAPVNPINPKKLDNMVCGVLVFRRFTSTQRHMPELSWNEIRELMCPTASSATPGACDARPKREIVVADRGWVFVADVLPLDNGDLQLTNASVIRVWGTTRGLGELAAEGVKQDTKLDPIPTTLIPARSVVFRTITTKL